MKGGGALIFSLVFLIVCTSFASAGFLEGITGYATRTNPLADWILGNFNLTVEDIENVGVEEPEVETQKCFDSDGGKNYYLKGIIKDQRSNEGGGNDRCVLSYSNGSSETVYNCVGPNCLLQESFCESEDSIYASGTGYKCPNGCEDGACLEDDLIKPMMVSDFEIKSVYPFDVSNLGFGNYKISAQYSFGSYHGGYWDENWELSEGALWVSFNWDRPETNVIFIDENGDEKTIYLPASDNLKGERHYNEYYWISEDGSSYYALKNHSSGWPDLSYEEALSPEHLARKADNSSVNIGNCFDSDNGYSPYEFGRISDMSGNTLSKDRCVYYGFEGISFPESCSGYDCNLMEYFCEGGEMQVDEVYCENGCKNGACLLGPISECYDSDYGESIFESGYVKNSEGFFQDACYGNELHELVCDENGFVMVDMFQCEYGCYDGACLEEPVMECEDSDGGENIYEFGYVFSSEGYYEDECFWDEVHELICDEDGNVIVGMIRCEYGCYDGACLEEPLVNDECYDSDGGFNIYEKGRYNYGYEVSDDIASQGSGKDYCISLWHGEEVVAETGDILNEYYCEDGELMGKVVFCNCVDGACVDVPILNDKCLSGECYFKEEDICLKNGETFWINSNDFVNETSEIVYNYPTKTQADILRLNPSDLSDIFEFSIENGGVVLNSLSSLNDDKISLEKVPSYYLKEEDVEFILKDIDYNKEDPQKSTIELISIYDDGDNYIDKYSLDDEEVKAAIKILDENTIHFEIDEYSFDLEKAHFMTMNVNGQEFDIAVKNYDVNYWRPQKSFVEFLVVHEEEYKPPKRIVSCYAGVLNYGSYDAYEPSYEVYEDLGFSEEVIEKYMLNEEEINEIIQKQIDEAFDVELIGSSSGGSTTSTSGMIKCENNQCLYDQKCYSYGFRKKGLYCDDRYDEFLPQKEQGETCDNSFECSSNVCVDSECVSSSLIQKMINWFNRVFGENQQSSTSGGGNTNSVNVLDELEY